MSTLNDLPIPEKVKVLNIVQKANGLESKNEKLSKQVKSKSKECEAAKVKFKKSLELLRSFYYEKSKENERNSRDEVKKQRRKEKKSLNTCVIDDTSDVFWKEALERRSSYDENKHETRLCSIGIQCSPETHTISIQYDTSTTSSIGVQCNDDYCHPKEVSLKTTPIIPPSIESKKLFKKYFEIMKDTPIDTLESSPEVRENKIDKELIDDNFLCRTNGTDIQAITESIEQLQKRLSPSDRNSRVEPHMPKTYVDDVKYSQRISKLQEKLSPSDQNSQASVKISPNYNTNADYNHNVTKLQERLSPTDRNSQASVKMSPNYTTNADYNHNVTKLQEKLSPSDRISQASVKMSPNYNTNANYNHNVTKLQERLSPTDRNSQTSVKMSPNYNTNANYNHNVTKLQEMPSDRDACVILSQSNLKSENSRYPLDISDNKTSLQYRNYKEPDRTSKENINLSNTIDHHPVIGSPIYRDRYDLDEVSQLIKCTNVADDLLSRDDDMYDEQVLNIIDALY